ncbi:MAG: class I SAM-dependent rRNA methyltransferase [Bryobacterales bacterium]|nr:class I SAM-dependent rRNA methyltransferase [Bryobacterales bacterium]
MALPEVKVNRKAASRVASGHPWLFSSDVVHRGAAQPGDVVRVADAGGRPLGVAHYSSTSQITLRLLSRRVEPVDRAFYVRRLERALAFRRQVVRESDSYRVVFGEADLLPGLVIDCYGGAHYVVQTLTQGMDKALPVILDALGEVCAPASVVARNDVAVREKESLPLETRVLWGEAPERVECRFNGLTWQVDLLGGQKTGIYLDQRENYVAAARWARGKALDCFTSTGGFSLHMAGRCEGVEAVDSSAGALATAAANASRNGIGNVHWREANAFDVLAGHHSAGRHFDTIVLDPPAFTKSRDAVEGAIRGYREINLRALKLLRAGGVLVSCSCSHHVSEAMLLEVIAEAALDAGKQLRVVERRSQAADHPILLTVPETLYLKCLVFQVAESY